MKKLGSPIKQFLLWMLYSAIAYFVVWVLLSISGIIWWPTGIIDSNLIQVAGDSWAITKDGRFFHKQKGNWEKLNIDTGAPIVWGTDIDFSSKFLVIATKTEVQYGNQSLPLPKLVEPIVAAGNVHFCMPDSYASSIFVSSPSEIAIYDWSGESWVVIPLQRRLSTPIVSWWCYLFYFTEKNLNSIKFEMPGSYAYSSISLEETQEDISKYYGDITSITSSNEYVWIMTTSNVVLQSRYEDDTMSWDVLPSPPVLENSRLISGTLGYTFGGGSAGFVDLWLMGDENVYWYNQEKRDWDVFKIYGRKPLALSALTTSSETVGYSVSRLAIVDGILMQQYPLDAKRNLWLVLSVPISGILGIIIFSVISHYRKVRITRTS